MRFSGVLVTGASSGLGRALAEACAGPGVTLHLAGRDRSRLSATAEACRTRGAEATEALFDVTDAEAAARWVRGAGRLDLVIAAAGVSAGSSPIEPTGQMPQIFATNTMGVLNTVLPAVKVMARQPPGADGIRGRVAVVSSLAAMVPTPNWPAYCGSKAAVLRWAEAMDDAQRPRGIRVHAVCPGFIRTPLSAQNPFRMPFMTDVEEAARRLLDGVAAGRQRIAFPWQLHLLFRLVAALPPRMRVAALARLAGRIG